MADPLDPPDDTTPEAGEFAGIPVVDTRARRCRHLRNNGMILFTDSSEEVPPDESSSTVYWCQKTMNGFGPDDDMVGWLDCRESSRSCYEPFY